MTTYFSEKTLLSPPTERAAFSDRQAYVCAELSRLAYFKFEGGHELDEVITFAKEVFGEDKRFALLEQKLRTVLTGTPTAAAEAEEAFAAILQQGGFALEKTYSVSGTQAFLCTKAVPLKTGGHKTVAFLAFRGTEPRDFRDIKSDIKASLIQEEVGRVTIQIHCGYRTALKHIETAIAEDVGALSADQLFVTGHSLGGALAVLYTRLYATAVNGACYTFGAPPVGGEEFQNDLKTPIYQIINEIDIVPRLPNPWMVAAIRVLWRIIRLLSKVVTVLNRLLASGSWDEKLETHIAAMTRYRYSGYTSYLVGAGAEARLRYSVSSYDQFRWWRAMMMKQWTGFNRMFSDHMIDVYVEKLKEHARKRNLPDRLSVVAADSRIHTDKVSDDPEAQVSTIAG